MSSNGADILGCTLTGGKQGEDAQLGESRLKNQHTVAHLTLLSIKFYRASLPQFRLCGPTYVRVGA